MPRRGNARPYDAPRSTERPRLIVDRLDVTDIGVEGTIAAIAGPTDDADYRRQLIQQCDRDIASFGGPQSGVHVYWFCRALYQQLMGCWTEQDERRLAEIQQASARPEYIEGPNGYAYERRLSDRAKAELARKEILP